MNHIEAARLARELMNQHGLIQVPFEWNRRKRGYGVCKWHYNTSTGQYFCQSIALSIYYVQMNNEQYVRNTILHEIAHALAGHGHGHDAHWRKTALSIGCTGERCTQGDITMPKGRYKASCDCGEVFYKHRAGKHVRRGNYVCTNCRRRLNFVDTKTPVYA